MTSNLVGDYLILFSTVQEYEHKIAELEKINGELENEHDIKYSALVQELDVEKLSKKDLVEALEEVREKKEALENCDISEEAKRRIEVSRLF